MTAITPQQILDILPLGSEGNEVLQDRLWALYVEADGIRADPETLTVDVVPLISAPLVVAVMAVELCATLTDRSIEEIIFDLRWVLSGR